MTLCLCINVTFWFLFLFLEDIFDSFHFIPMGRDEMDSKYSIIATCHFACTLLESMAYSKWKFIILWIHRTLLFLDTVIASCLKSALDLRSYCDAPGFKKSQIRRGGEFSESFENLLKNCKTILPSVFGSDYLYYYIRYQSATFMIPTFLN